MHQGMSVTHKSLLCQVPRTWAHHLPGRAISTSRGRGVQGMQEQSGAGALDQCPGQSRSVSRTEQDLLNQATP